MRPLPTTTLPHPLQGLPVTKGVIYRNVDRKAWELIVKEYSNVGLVVVTK